jgi:heterodisulfide reductase subunit C
MSEVVKWYREAQEKSCVWWLENHVIAKHSLSSCMSCGACTALCPAAEFYEFNPRVIMTLVQEKNEKDIIELLKSDTIWYCHQCGSCKPKCPRKNSPFGMVTSLRQLSQIKGYHTQSVRGRQQYFARHLWGGNLWNRACTLYFRNADPVRHRDFGPRFAAIFKEQAANMQRIGACPDMDGPMSGRKVHPESLEELRHLWLAGGAVHFWSLIEDAAQEQARQKGLTIDEYYESVMTEG